MKYVGASYKIQAYRRILMEFVWVTYFISTAIYYLFNDRFFNFNKNSHCLESFLERRYNHITKLGVLLCSLTKIYILDDLTELKIKCEEMFQIFKCNIFDISIKLYVTY